METGRSAAAQFFTSTCRSGSESHAGKVHIQTYLLRLEHMSVYCCPKGLTNVSIANILTSNWGSFKGPPSASGVDLWKRGKKYCSEKTEVEDKKPVCARNMKIKLGQGSMQRSV